LARFFQNLGFHWLWLAFLGFFRHQNPTKAKIERSRRREKPTCILAFAGFSGAQHIAATLTKSGAGRHAPTVMEIEIHYHK